VLVSRAFCFLVFATTILPACDQPRPPEAKLPPPRVWELSPGSLTRTAANYTGQRVRVLLPAGCYDVAPGEIHFHTIRNGRPPQIVFTCDRVPLDNTHPLIVTGTVAAPLPNSPVQVQDCIIAHPVPPGS
jgi:hypothetical protein